MTATDLAGRVAVVTGAGSGIGASVARALGDRGASVVAADIEDARGVAETIDDGTGEAVAVEADVTDPGDVEAMVTTAVEEFGGLDCAVNNAGVGGDLAPTAEYPLDSWEHVVDVNLTGVFLCSRAELDAMLDDGGGAIVNVASVLGKVGFETAPAYVAAKHGVLGLTRTTALEYATDGVRVNAVCPGFVKTPMHGEAARTDGEERRRLAERHPVDRMGDPEEVAALVTWLCSEEASFVTGAAYDVDGGYLAR